jgi:hypothetical protein
MNPQSNPILSQMNPVHAYTPCFLNINLSITLPQTYMPRSPKWHFHLQVSHRNFVYLMQPMCLKCINPTTIHPKTQPQRTKSTNLDSFYYAVKVYGSSHRISQNESQVVSNVCCIITKQKRAMLRNCTQD